MRLSAESTAIVLDSTCDLPEGHGRPTWRVVPLYVRFGDEEAKREYVDMSTGEFYRRLRESESPPKSAQPSPADFAAVFEELSGYERILCVVLSAKLSGTCASAELAAQDFGERVRVLDSRVTSGGTVILADAIQRRLDRGTDDEEIDALVEQFRRERGLLFTVDTLEYLVRGGRVGKAAGLAGQLLSVKPILAFDDGEVAPLKRVRGRAKALGELEEIFRDSTEGQDSPDLHVGVGHAEAREDCDELVRRVQAARPDASLDIVTTLGPVIGTHGGPGTLGLFWFWDSLTRSRPR
ncbi:MAG TPA: DegV family protein [Gaiellaceae bacterium]|nr:DegV family protein [Gaiellaceae bacterium]